MCVATVIAHLAEAGCATCTITDYVITDQWPIHLEGIEGIEWTLYLMRLPTVESNGCGGQHHCIPVPVVEMMLENGLMITRIRPS